MTTRADIAWYRQGTRARRTEKVSLVIAREILNDIADRRLDPGAMLPAESDMLRAYGVGRASLREALRLLEVQGLISIKPGPGGGPIVAGVNSDDFGRMATMYFHMSGATFRELVEARLVMEPVMAGVAARRQDPVLTDRLRKSVALAGQSPPPDVDAYTRKSLDFHSLVAGMSGNRILDLIGRSLKDIYADRIRELVFPEDERQKIMAAHEDIANAIIGGNAGRAERLMRQHMEDFAHYIERRFPGMMDEMVDWR